jgi:methylmalonyl-CoA/ethylmalonyl-CoA epimerase
MSVEFGAVMQHGYIVADVRASVTEWAERIGAGPFYLVEHMRMDEYYFRGLRVPVEIRMAFGYWHGIQIELIEPLGSSDSLYSRALKTSAGKLNHVATVVSDLDALLARRQLREHIIQHGNMPSGLKFAYLDEYVPGGLHLELIEAQPSTLMAFAGMEKAARHWDGRDPLRPIAALAQELARSG